MIRTCLDACRPIAYLHSKGYIHRDIKSLNYLMSSEDFGLKLADFGLSRELPDEKQGLNEYPEEDDDAGIAHAVNMTLRVGTRQWMAPEMLERKAYTRKADVYSLAVVLWEIITGGVPFSELNRDDIQANVLKGARPPIPLKCPLALKSLLEISWHENSSLRPTADEVVRRLELILQEVQITPASELPSLIDLSVRPIEQKSRSFDRIQST